MAKFGTKTMYFFLSTFLVLACSPSSGLPHAILTDDEAMSIESVRRPSSSIQDGGIDMSSHQEQISSPEWKGRKTITHKDAFMSAKQPSPFHRRPPKPCRFKHCYPGQKCVLENGRAKCVCKQHCSSARTKPLCGSDGSYYANRCEMHRAACLASRDIYDARHRDCFYLRSECSADDFSAFRAKLLASSYVKPRDPADENPRSRQTTAVSRQATARYRRRRSSGGSHRHPHHHRSRIDPAHSPHHQHHLKKVPKVPEVPEVPVVLDAGEEEAPNQDDLSVFAASVEQGSKVGGSVPDRAETDEVSRVEATHPDSTMKLPDASNTQEGTIEQVDAGSNSSGNMDNAWPPPTPSTPTDQMLYLDALDAIITGDPRGDLVKRLFKFVDLDMDGFVGSEEIYEVTLLEDLDAIFASSCSLFHVLHYADSDDDHVVNIHELLNIFNVTVLHLSRDRMVVSQTANQDEGLTLQCGIQGEPNPEWRRHEYDLNVEGSDSVEVDGALLYFDHVTAEHAGNYSCHARKRPDMFQVIRLSVYSRPHVQVYPRTQHRPAGSSVTIECRASGMPSPEIAWRINGEDVNTDTGRFLLLGNGTELHINSALISDSAAYSCLASNLAGHSEEIAAVFIEEENSQSTSIDRSIAAFIAFHDSGILVMQPRSCQVVRRIHSAETVPGLLPQNSLCKMNFLDGLRHCNWSTAVAAGTRFVYAAQPEENRLVVVDASLQRVVEVLPTDPIPALLEYVPSTDQLFVHCWVDESRERSTLQVVSSASVPGTHYASQIQPLDGGNRVDLSVFSFFVPPESGINTQSQHAFVAHRNEQTIYRLDLTTLLYDDDTIDLRPYGCFPEDFSYQPIGGRLHVTCARGADDTARTLTVEYGSSRVVKLNEDSSYDREFLSKDNLHVVRVMPDEQQLVVFNLTTSGDLTDSIVLHTNFAVSDVAFDEKYGNNGAASVYVSSQVQGEVMYLDAASNSVQVINNLFRPVDVASFPWSRKNRLLVPSAWYDRHIAVTGSDGLDVIDVESNEASCRFSDVTGVMAIVWTDGDM